MTQPFQQWKVLPHGKLSEIDDNILTVTGEIRMPIMDLPRRMTVVRLSDSRLVVFSAIALVVSAKAGTQCRSSKRRWIPAFPTAR